MSLFYSFLSLTYVGPTLSHTHYSFTLSHTLFTSHTTPHNITFYSWNTFWCNVYHITFKISPSSEPTVTINKPNKLPTRNHHFSFHQHHWTRKNLTPFWILKEAPGHSIFFQPHLHREKLKYHTTSIISGEEGHKKNILPSHPQRTRPTPIFLSSFFSPPTKSQSHSEAQAHSRTYPLYNINQHNFLHLSRSQLSSIHHRVPPTLATTPKFPEYSINQHRGKKKQKKEEETVVGTSTAAGESEFQMEMCDNGMVLWHGYEPRFNAKSEKFGWRQWRLWLRRTSPATTFVDGTAVFRAFHGREGGRCRCNTDDAFCGGQRR